MPSTKTNTARRPRGAAPPRIVLLWIVVIVVVAAVLYGVAPYVLPARIYEGPYVQMADETGVTLRWYLTRPAACSVVVDPEGAAQRWDSAADGTAQRVRIDGLQPGRSYSYRVSAGDRALTDTLTFQTNRAPGQRFQFMVFGDSGRGTRVQYKLAGVMTRYTPQADLLVHTGDVVYPDGARYRYAERFFAPYRHLLARVNLWPCLGNHDVDADGRAPGYEEVFELPANGPDGLPAGHNYWFDYASSRFAVIDSNPYMTEERLRDEVAPWLYRVLGDPTPEWRFVVLHHPPYTGGKYAPDERVQRALVPTFEAVGVDIVFSGHDHNYQRTHPLRGGQIVPDGEGVVYLISGAGGADLYTPRGPAPAYVAALNNQVHSFTFVTVEGRELSLRQVSLNGETLDQAALFHPEGDVEETTVPADGTDASGP